MDRLHRQEATSKDVYSIKAQKRNQSDLYKSAQQQEEAGQDGEEALRPPSLIVSARSSNDHPGRPSPDPNPGRPSMYQRAVGLTKSLIRHLAHGIMKTIETVRPGCAPAKVLEVLIASVGHRWNQCSFWDYGGRESADILQLDLPATCGNERSSPKKNYGPSEVVRLSLQ